jgi:hypothetical protein
MAWSSKSAEKIEAGSGKVLADLGLPDAAQRDCLTALGSDIEIRIRPHAGRGLGRILVQAA